MPFRCFFLILLNKKEFNTFLDREMICDFFYIILNFVSVFKRNIGINRNIFNTLYIAKAINE